MDRQLYTSLATRASDLVVAGERHQAIEILEQLVASDLPAFDRAIMCMNIAIIQSQLGDTDEALATYASAIDIERQTEGYFVAQSRAAYYSELGMYDESRRSYQDLLLHAQLKPEDRVMFETNIETLGRLAGH